MERKRTKQEIKYNNKKYKGDYSIMKKFKIKIRSKYKEDKNKSFY